MNSRILIRIAAALLLAWLGLWTTSAPAIAPPLTAEMTHDVQSGDCPEHGTMGKVADCCSACPCCIALVEEPFKLPRQPAPRPVMQTSALALGLVFAPEPIPPRIVF